MFCTAGLVVSYALVIHQPHHRAHALLCAPTQHECNLQWNGAVNALIANGVDYKTQRIECVREPKEG